MKYDFISIIKNAVEEKNKTLSELLENNIISENTFYKYRHRIPSLNTLINICNYLEISIDYLLELTTENNFKTYKYSSMTFYNNLITLLTTRKISGRKFCSDLNFSNDNIIRWKNGTVPSVQILIEIANYFNILIDDLILE